jgi:hypothetical protein
MSERLARLDATRYVGPSSSYWTRWEAALTRGGKLGLDGEPFRLETEDGLEVYLQNDAGRSAVVHVAPDGRLVEV